MTTLSSTALPWPKRMAILGREHFELKLAFVLITLILLIILAYPLYCILSQSFYGEEGFTLSNYARAFEKDSFFTALRNSFLVSGCVAFFATAIAFFAAYGLNF